MESIGEILQGKKYPPVSSGGREERLARLRALRDALIKCKTCRDLGLVPGVGESVMLCPDCQAEKKARWLWECSGLTEKDRGMAFETFLPRQGTSAALAASRALAEGTGPPGLVLIGQPGTGKTHLAKAVCQARLAKGLEARFWLVPELLDWLREGYEAGESVPYAERMKAVVEFPFLVLDDIGMEVSTPWASEHLDMLIDHRYSRELPLMVTANPENLGAKASNGRLSARIISRLWDRKRAAIIKITTSDFRLAP